MANDDDGGEQVETDTTPVVHVPPHHRNYLLLLVLLPFLLRALESTQASVRAMIIDTCATSQLKPVGGQIGHPRWSNESVDRYKDLLAMAMADGKVAASEEGRLAEAREKYKIPLGLHRELVRGMSGTAGTMAMGIGAQRVGWIDLQADRFDGVNGWLTAAVELEIDVQPAMAWSFVRLVACHWLQPCCYFLALHSAESAELLSPLQQKLGGAVAIREAIYLLLMLYAAIVRPAVLLVQLDAHADASVRGLDKLYYTCAPEKFMVQPVLGYSQTSTNALVGLLFFLDACGVAALSISSIQTNGHLPPAPLIVGYCATLTGLVVLVLAFAASYMFVPREEGSRWYAKAGTPVMGVTPVPEVVFPAPSWQSSAADTFSRRVPDKGKAPPRDRQNDLDRYKDLLAMAMADGQVAESERARLAQAREKYGIPLDVHQELMQGMVANSMRGRSNSIRTVWDVPAGSEQAVLRGSPESQRFEERERVRREAAETVPVDEGAHIEAQARAEAADRAWRAQADEEAAKQEAAELADDDFHEYNHSFPSRPLGFSLMPASDSSRGAMVNVIRHAALDEHLKSNDRLISINGEDISRCMIANVAKKIVHGKLPLQIRFRRLPTFTAL
jgi:hypothetical protein